MRGLQTSTGSVLQTALTGYAVLTQGCFQSEHPQSHCPHLTDSCFPWLEKQWTNQQSELRMRLFEY